MAKKVAAARKRNQNRKKNAGCGSDYGQRFTEAVKHLYGIARKSGQSLDKETRKQIFTRAAQMACSPSQTAPSAAKEAARAVSTATMGMNLRPRRQKTN